MSINYLNHLLKKKSLPLTFCVLFSLFISENIFAIKYWKDTSLMIGWGSYPEYYVILVCEVYNVRFGYLEECRFEASADGQIYYRLMEISNPRQNQKEITKINLKNKLTNAKIEFIDQFVFPLNRTNWPENKDLHAKIKYVSGSSVVCLGWYVDPMDVSHIRILGKWHGLGTGENQTIDKVTYKLKRPGPFVLKSDAPGTITETSKNDIVMMNKDSESMDIKGTETGSNIKVYTTSGTEIRSVISNNDLVNIKLPAKQIYIVHIGQSRYKVAL